MQVDLSNKVAVVTGGGGILCSVMTKRFAVSGASAAIGRVKGLAGIRGLEFGILKSMNLR